MDTSNRPRRYFAIHYLFLRFLGLGWWHHPDERDTTNFPGWYLYYAIFSGLVWVVGFVGLETIDPFIGEKDIDRFMFSLSFVITHDLTLIKLYIFFFRNKEIQEVVRTLEIELQQFYQNNERNRRTVKATKIMTSIFMFFGYMTIGNSNVYGIIQDIKWKSDVMKNVTVAARTLPQPIYIPWSYQTDRSYISTFLLETIGLLWTGHIVMIIDTFIGSLILHMSNQFIVLQEAIKTVHDRTLKKIREGGVERASHNLMTNREIDFESALNIAILDCVRQHQLLISLSSKEFHLPSNKEELSMTAISWDYRANFVINIFSHAWINIISTSYSPLVQNEGVLSSFVIDLLTSLKIRSSVVLLIRIEHYWQICVEKFAKTYSYGFMTQLLSSMAAICVVMVQVSQDASSLKSIRLVTSLAFFTAMIIQLALQCFTANEMTYQAGLVSEAVMQCKWECISPRLRRPLLMIMTRTQRPLRLTAAGFANMDTACFLAIMKAAYSYYAVLSQKQA